MKKKIGLSFMAIYLLLLSFVWHELRDVGVLSIAFILVAFSVAFAVYAYLEWIDGK